MSKQYDNKKKRTTKAYSFCWIIEKGELKSKHKENDYHKYLEEVFHKKYL